MSCMLGRGRGPLQPCTAQRSGRRVRVHALAHGDSLPSMAPLPRVRSPVARVSGSATTEEKGWARTAAFTRSTSVSFDPPILRHTTRRRRGDRVRGPTAAGKAGVPAHAPEGPTPLARLIASAEGALGRRAARRVAEHALRAGKGSRAAVARVGGGARARGKGYARGWRRGPQRGTCPM